MNSPEAVKPVITYDTSPAQYKHWSLACDGAIATLTLNINEDGGIKPGYKLKLNSYDLGVTWSCTTPCSACASSIPK